MDKGSQGLFIHWGRGTQVRKIKPWAERKSQVTDIESKSKNIENTTDLKIKLEIHRTQQVAINVN